MACDGFCDDHLGCFQARKPVIVAGRLQQVIHKSPQMLLQVVPTVYTNIRNETLHTNQFSVTENFRESGDTSGGGRNLPGVFFFYDMSPIKVGHHCMKVDVDISKQ